MESIDLNFFLEPPVLDTAAILTIEALAPLSMVSAQPGAYYRSQAHPTDAMIFGMLENALGWHFGGETRTKIIEGKEKKKKQITGLRAEAKARYGQEMVWHQSSWLSDSDLPESGSGFASLLTYHLKVETQFLPQVISFDDYWLKNVNTGSKNSFLGSSKHHDYRVSEIFKRQQSGKLVFGDGKEKSETNEDGFNRLTLEEMQNAPEGTKIKLDCLKPYFPYYYISPAIRTYVVPNGSFQYRMKTTQTLSHLLMSALNDPAAPLYLGSNDGWVEANWEMI